VNLSGRPALSNHKIKSVELVYDTERIKVLIDDTRREILRVLSKGIDRDGQIYQDMTIAEIADELGTNPQRLYHHIDKLTECNFIFKTREERKKRSITSYYSRTARAFIVSYSNEKKAEEVDALIDNFMANFVSLLDIDLNYEEQEKFERYIGQLTSMAAEIFADYSHENGDTETITEKIEHLYFLLEFFLFYRNETSRKVLLDLTDLIHPKLNVKRNREKPTVAY
jgi:DNA-binding transcriptional ArsR family regulator